MSLYSVKIKTTKRFSITCEFGDILDISYFAKKINKPVKEIISLLRENDIEYIIDNGTLSFATEADAVAAINCLSQKFKLMNAG